jgi:endo-1,4-beta-mannosidase
MKGFNYFPRNYAWGAMTEWDWSEVEFELAWGASLGANTVRTVIDYGFSTNNPDHEGNLVAMAHPTPEYIAAMQHFLAISDRYGLKVIFTLFDFMPGWFFIDQGRHDIAGAYLGELLPHFTDDARIVAWDILNEGDLLPEKFGTDINRVLDFYRAMSEQVKSLAPNHLITAGFGKIDRAHLSEDFVHFVSFHYYEDQATFTRDIQALRGRLSRPLPIVAQEFGYPSAGNPWAGLSAHTVRLGGYLDIALMSEELAGALFWMLTDLNPPRTSLTRAYDVNQLDLKYGVFDGLFHQKLSYTSVRKFFTGVYNPSRRIRFRYTQEPTPFSPQDGRYLAIGFLYLRFVDANGSTIAELNFGSKHTNQFQGQGWYPTETWGQWAGSLDKTATLYLSFPEETTSIQFGAYSPFSVPNEVSLEIGNRVFEPVTLTPNAVNHHEIKVP